MPTKEIKAIALSAPIAIEAAAQDGDKPTPPKFNVVAYTGGTLELGNYEHPVVVDTQGVNFRNSLVANLHHDDHKEVGHVTEKSTMDGKIVLAGSLSVPGVDRDKVVNASAEGFEWQASIEAYPQKMEFVKAGKSASANGQTFTGPVYIARKSQLRGFAFVPHGADDNTSATIAASAAVHKGQKMDAEIRAWAEQMGIDVDSQDDATLAVIEANYNGKNAAKAPPIAAKSKLDARRIEAQRKRDIQNYADDFCERYDADEEMIDAVQDAVERAIKAKNSLQEFKNELLESRIPLAEPPRIMKKTSTSITADVLKAAICQAGNLPDDTLNKDFSDQVLQAAHTNFRHGISLGELFIHAAQANGYRGPIGGRVTQDIHNAAFFGNGMRPIHAGGGGFSVIDVSDIVSATANKFKHEGWMHVDLTPLRIAAIRSVRNFQQVTTVSLTGHLQYEKIGSDGEIKHGTLGELTYTNQADTYATMLAITRKDIINDDLDCLTQTPRRLGRGAALKLNDIFWTEFLVLVSASFFAAGNNNINTGVATMTIEGLAATETIFMNQTDPDGKPLGIMPRIVLVPTALKAAATALLNSQGSVLITGASTTTIPDANVFQGRFRVESSPYISNSSYTGNTAVAWWMLADPSEAAVIEIAALNGQVEPTVETADAAFNTLGVQMRGYSDVGVARQEKRAGVHADGGAS